MIAENGNIIKQEGIEGLLKELEKERLVLGKIEEGELIEKSPAGHIYRIDGKTFDLIYNHIKVPNTPKGSIPYTKIRRILPSDKFSLDKIFNGERSPDRFIYADFSKVIEEGAGECLEKAIVTQILAQEGRDSYLVCGTIYPKQNPEKYERHAYNFIKKKGIWYLVDVQIPKKSGEPFIVPIEGIDTKKNWIKIILPSKYEREYDVCMGC